MLLLVIASASYFVVQLLKRFWPIRLASTVKMLASFAACFGASTVFEPHQYLKSTVYGLAGAGLASGLHKLIRLISVMGDTKIKEFLRQR